MLHLDLSTQWLSEQLEATAGRLVEYKRGPITLAECVMVPVHREYTIEDRDFPIKVAVYDWSIRRAALELFATPFLPQQGDVILDYNGGDPESVVPTKYEVLSLPNRPCWEDEDGGYSIRIHTKLIPQCHP